MPFPNLKAKRRLNCSCKETKTVGLSRECYMLIFKKEPNYYFRKSLTFFVVFFLLFIALLKEIFGVIVRFDPVEQRLRFAQTMRKVTKRDVVKLISHPFKCKQMHKMLQDHFNINKL